MTLRQPKRDVTDRQPLLRTTAALDRPKCLSPLGVEARRLAALRGCRILDTPAAPAFDRLTRLVSQFFDVPVAGIAFVTEEQIWFKSALGISRDSIPRAETLCDEVVRRRELVTVENCAGLPGLRFYAGAPLLTPDGQAIGTLFLADRVPRVLPPDQCRALQEWAAVVMHEVLRHGEASGEAADRDALTGLLSHRSFHEDFQGALLRAREGGQSLTVLLLDLADFRFLNETYGHVVGDDVLRRVADALAELAGELGASSPARYGGDEFALLLPGTGLEGVPEFVRAVAARLERLDYSPPDHDSAIPLSLSSGAACFPDDGAGRRELLAAADGRLRRAKSGAGDNGQADRLRALLARSVEGFSMLDALVTAVDSKDRYTRSHSEDVLFYCLKIAEALGLDQKDQQTLAVAALLHDVGKIGVPDAVLRKPGSLTEAEFAAVRHHPLMGAVIVGAVSGLEGTLDAVRHHHERWDGGGYPFGLRGEAIPLMARLMAVADAFSAMTTDRPYRKGMAPDRARAILEQGAGTQWDPACVRAICQDRPGGSA